MIKQTKRRMPARVSEVVEIRENKMKLRIEMKPSLSRPKKRRKGSSKDSARRRGRTWKRLPEHQLTKIKPWTRPSRNKKRLMTSSAI